MMGQIKQFKNCQLNPPTSIVKKNLSYFVNKNTNMFLKLFDSDIEFVFDEPEQWSNINAYKIGTNIVAHINIVNNIAKRGVQLIKEYNNKIIKNEKQKQYLLQTVKHHKNNPTAKSQHYSDIL